MTVGHRITLINIAIYQTLAKEANPEDPGRALLLKGLRQNGRWRPEFDHSFDKEDRQLLEEFLCLADIVANTAGAYDETSFPNLMLS